MRVQRDWEAIIVTYNTASLATQVNYGSGDSDNFAWSIDLLLAFRAEMYNLVSYELLGSIARQNSAPATFPDPARGRSSHLARPAPRNEVDQGLRS